MGMSGVGGSFCSFVFLISRRGTGMERMKIEEVEWVTAYVNGWNGITVCVRCLLLHTSGDCGGGGYEGWL